MSTMTKNVYDIVERNSKFLVTKNGEPINLPSITGSNIVTEFDTRSDAEKYVRILKSLRINK